MEKQAYWFHHDSNAHRDIKILKMTKKYGAEGYGMYWILIEMMREQANYKLECNGIFSDEVFSELLMCEPKKAKDFMKDCVDAFKLFESDGEHLWSPSLIRRMKANDELREKRSIAGKKGGMRPSSKQQALLNQKRGEEKKEEKKREYTLGVFLTPTEYDKLKEKLGERETLEYIQQLGNYIKAYGKESKYKSHYHTILTWHNRDQKEGRSRSNEPASRWDFGSRAESADG